VVSRTERPLDQINVLAFCLAPAFSSLSLFVVTKSNQKRPDKMNSLRLRLRSNSILSQWRGLFYASRLLMRVLCCWCADQESGVLGAWSIECGQKRAGDDSRGGTCGRPLIRMRQSPNRRFWFWKDDDWRSKFKPRQGLPVHYFPRVQPRWAIHCRLLVRWICPSASLRDFVTPCWNGFGITPSGVSRT